MLKTATLKQISEDVRVWYEASRSFIPDIDSPQFGTMAGNVNQIASRITLGAADNFTFKVDPKAETAFIARTGSKKEIVFPGWYFSRKAITSAVGTDKDVDFEAISLALMNGSGIHETAHAALTPDTLKELTAGITFNQVSATVANMVEDLYIEAAVNRTSAIGGAMLASKNRIFFHEDEATRLAKKVKHAFDSSKLPELEDLLNLMMMTKNADLRDLIFEAIPDKLGSHLKSAILQGRISGRFSYNRSGKANVRVEIITKIYNILVDMYGRNAITEVPTTLDFNTTGGDGGGEAMQSEVSMSGDEEAVEQVAAAANQTMAMIHTGASAKNPENASLRGNLQKAVSVDIIETTVPESSRSSAHTAGNYGFLSILRQLRATNTTPGEPRKAGARLVNTRISRIATDRKMFSNHDATRKVTVPTEVVILADASGSMGADFFSKVMAETKGIYEALKKLGIAVSVYAHSSQQDLAGADRPIIYRIAAFGTTSRTSNDDARFERSLNIDQSQNYDGVVISHLTRTAFHLKNANKFLFVLSDGEPAGHDYSGWEANDHTMKCISLARRAGINVISFSLKAEVVKDNDRIYGEANNIDCTVGGVGRAFEAKIMALQAEGRM